MVPELPHKFHIGSFYHVDLGLWLGLFLLQQSLCKLLHFNYLVEIIVEWLERLEYFNSVVGYFMGEKLLSAADLGVDAEPLFDEIGLQLRVGTGPFPLVIVITLAFLIGALVLRSFTILRNDVA